MSSLTLRPARRLGREEKGDRLWLIAECRKANALFASPPLVELLSGDGLPRIEVDSSGLANGESPGLHNGCADVADCFHMMRLPGEIRHFSAGQGYRTSTSKMTEIEGIKVSPNQTLWPMCCSLPTGFSWSLYFAQSANQARLNRHPSVRHGVEMTDGHYLYVDNIGIVSDHVAQEHMAMNESKQDFEGDRLVVHEISMRSDSNQALDFELNVGQLRTRPTLERFGRIRKGLRCIFEA